MMPDAPSPADPAVRKILTLDGGGIRGVFPAAFLAKLEEHLDEPIGRYFDLIVGTSTGAIIAVGLGLGLTAGEILKFYEQKGPEIFDQHRGPVANWIVRQLRSARHWVERKYSNEPLRTALVDVLGDKLIGESRTRLVVPAWHPILERVYLYKTAHHPRFETDYRQPAVDAVMASAAAPTFLDPYLTTEEVELVDGGVWANNPIGVAAVEAVGVLSWPGDRLKILSIGTTNDVKAPGRLGGKLGAAPNLTRLFMAGQSHSALGAARIITGDGHDRRAIWRINQTVPLDRYTLDDVSRIAEMKNRAVAEAREQLPELRRHFFGETSPDFQPFHQLAAERTAA